jgi:ABC-type sugar transport system substrate-binding protein
VLEPNSEEAGYLTASVLISKARAQGLFGSDHKLHMIAIAGDRSTTTSLKRNQGMLRAVTEQNDVVLEQQVYGEWNRAKAREQSEWLYQRYPQVRLVWAGNDLMAFGAMESWAERGGKPGGDALFSGINTSEEAMTKLRPVVWLRWPAGILLPVRMHW